jgi:hypothetical protein
VTDFRTACERPLPDGVRVVAGEVEDGRCPANTQRREDFHLRELVGEHHRRVAERRATCMSLPSGTASRFSSRAPKTSAYQAAARAASRTTMCAEIVGTAVLASGSFMRLLPPVWGRARGHAAGSCSIRARLGDPRSNQRVKLVGDYQCSVVRGESPLTCASIQECPLTAGSLEKSRDIFPRLALAVAFALLRLSTDLEAVGSCQFVAANDGLTVFLH